MGRRILLLCVCLSLLAGVIACSRESDAPAVTSRTRVVALSPAIAVTIRDLGQSPALVGRHGFDQWSDQSLDVCGDQTGIDYESLLAARPTHVYVQWGTRDLPRRLQDLAAEHSWTLRSLNPLALDEVVAMTRTLHADLGGDDALIERLEQSWRPRDNIRAERIGRVAIWSVSDGSGTGAGGGAGFALLGPGSFHHDILVRLGATAALEKNSPFVMLDAEDMTRLAPDAVIVLLPREPGTVASASPGSGVRQPPAPLVERLRELSVPAANGGERDIRMALVDDSECLLPGSNLSRVADAMAEALIEWSRSDR